MASFIFLVFLIFLAIPIIILLVLARIFVKDKIFGKLLRIVVVGIIGILLILSFTHFINSKKALTKTNIYGTYIIDRAKYSGKQADWQYNHFRF